MTESCLHTISNQKKEEQAEQPSLTSTGSRPGPVNELVITKLTERVIHRTPFRLLDNILITLSQRSLEVWELQWDLREPPTASSAPLLAAPQSRWLLTAIRCLDPSKHFPSTRQHSNHAQLYPTSPRRLHQARLQVLQSNQDLFSICCDFHPETWGNSMKKSNPLCVKDCKNNEWSL